MKTNWILPLAAFALLAVGSTSYAGPPLGDPIQMLAELIEKRDAAMADWQKELRATKDPEARQKIWESRPGPEFLAGFKEVAVLSKGTETAEKAWLEVFDLATEIDKIDDAKLALEAIVADHVTSENLAGFASSLSYAAQAIGRDKVATALRTIVQKSPHRTVQAPALFSLGTTLVESSDAEEKAEARRALERVQSEFADVKPKRGPAYAERAKGFLFEMDHLQIGMTVPDFESIDENGQKFRLSDYKGKVVVLDFWGNW